MTFPEGISPEEREKFDAWAKHQRETNIKNMAGSAFVLQLFTPLTVEQFDVSFALQIGVAILLDKPIVPVIYKGAKMPDHLRKIATKVIELEGDLDTEAGQEEFHKQLKPILKELGVEMNDEPRA